MFVETNRHQRRILSATRALVKRNGYAAVSLRDIASAAGYSPAGLYAHFAGRDAILAALADGVRAELTETLEQAAATAVRPDERLVSIGQAYVAFAVAHPSDFELLFRATRSRRRARNEARPTLFDLLRREARSVRPRAPEDIIDQACLGLWAVAHGLAALRTSHLAGFPGAWEEWTRAVLRAQVEGALGQRGS